MNRPSLLLWQHHRDEIVEMVREALDSKMPQQRWLYDGDDSVFLTTVPDLKVPQRRYLVTWVGPWDTRGTIELDRTGRHLANEDGQPDL